MSALLLAISAAVVLVPGSILALAAGMRGWLLAAGAPVLTYGVLGLFGPLVPVLGLRWSPWVLLAGTALLAVLLRLVRGRVPEVPPVWNRNKHLVTGGAVVAAAGVGSGLMFFASKGFSEIPQFWDAVFHGNAVRFISDSGDSAPSALNVISQPGAENFFYPNGYHLLVATAHQLGLGDVPRALGSANALLAGIFALSMAALLRTLGVRAAVVATTAVLCCVFTGFPYDLVTWGPLYPYATGVALLPAALALAIRVLDAPSRATVLPAGLALVGLTAIHPSVSVAAAVFGVFLLAQRWISARRVPLAELLALAGVAATALVLGIAHVLGTLGAAGGGAYDWAASKSPAEAVGRLVFFTRSFDEPQWWLVAPFVLGLITLRRLSPLVWLFLGSVFFGALSVMASAYEGPWVAALTAPWWNDDWRLAVLYLLGVFPLAGLGLVTLFDLVRRPFPRRLWVSATAAALGIALFAYLSNGFYVARNEERLALAFGGGPTVTALERQAMDQLATIAPPGVTVLNDAQDGSAWMWALTGLRPLYGHVQIVGQENNGLGRHRSVLRERFHHYDTDPEVREAAKALNVRYVFVSEGFVAGGLKRAPGLLEVTKVRALRLIINNKDAQVYELTAPEQAGQGNGAQPGKATPGGAAVVTTTPSAPKPNRRTSS